MKKNGHACRQVGYTLVEIIVVVASVGLIMTAMVGVILGSFRVQNRANSESKIMENGNWIINELRRNVFNSYSDKIKCSDDKKSVEVMSLLDAKTTVLSCDQGTSKIASTSATEKVLNNDEVEVLKCDSFVSCEMADNKATEVTFTFTLGTTGDVGSSQVFTTKVTMRN